MTLPLTPDELLTTTRAVRKRLDLSRPVPLKLIKECIEIALQAPSGGNTQRWHWIVVTDADQRGAIADIYRAQWQIYAASPYSAAQQFADDPSRAPVQHRVGDSADYLGQIMHEVPALVLPAIAGTLAGSNQAGIWGSLLPAAWSYCLAARARGLGTAWTTLHLGAEGEIAEVLGLPPKIHTGVLIPTAYYTGDTFRRAPRQPLDEVLHIDRW